MNYFPKIKKEVPNLYLSKIEFNKSKVINKADLYSMQRRQFQMQNMDENIKLIKKTKNNKKKMQNKRRKIPDNSKLY